MNKKISDLNLKYKRCLIRVDYNVPIKDGIILDDFRIKSSLNTINYCLNKEGTSIVLMSHLGRPNGEIIPNLSLDCIASHLQQLLNKEVIFSKDCISKESISLSKRMKAGEIHLLENLRFYKEEIDNNKFFCNNLAKHGDIYINDAFATMHRAHASNVGVPKIIKEKGIGVLVENELEYLYNKLSRPKKPCALLLGGVKVSDKMPIIENLINKIDLIMIGGAMAFTFLKVKGKNIGNSIIDYNNLGLAENILRMCEKHNIRIALPIDIVVSSQMSSSAEWEVVNVNDIKSNKSGFDIGPETCINYEMMISDIKTIIWNGPMGVCEIPIFSTGTQTMANIIKNKTNKGLISIIGGGDTASALKELCINDGFSHLSTGGGASLQLMSGKELPALKALYEHE